ncbi:MAG: TIGR03016 family PEP-CTERM system-associated outer membrane protein [Nitrospirota bacterium]
MTPYYAEGAEFRIQPSITLGEEYNDNIFLVPENRSYDYISRIAPSISLMYKAHLWDWDVNYLYDYRYFARYYIKEDRTHALNLANHTRIIDEYVFLDLRDNYARISIDPTRDYTQESTFVNQTDRNTLTVNPYFITRPTSQMTVTTGYSYSNTWYKDPTAIDETEHDVYTGLQQELSQRMIMIAGVKHTLDKNRLQEYTQDDVFLGQKYEYVANSTLSIRVGNSWFDNKGAEKTSQVFWDASFIHRYSTMTVTYETGLRFIPDPILILRREDRYLATISKAVERSSLSVSGGLIEYRNVINKHLETSSYQVTGTLNHALTTKSKIILDLGAYRLKDYLVHAKTDRYLTGARFEHLLAENLTLALDYRYTNVYSPDVYSYNYFNNRFSFELRKVF